MNRVHRPLVRPELEVARTGRIEDRFVEAGAADGVALEPDERREVLINEGRTNRRDGDALPLGRRRRLRKPRVAVALRVLAVGALATVVPVVGARGLPRQCAPRLRALGELDGWETGEREFPLSLSPK